MAPEAPFPFLGHTTRPAPVHLWLALADPSASTEPLRVRLAALPGARSPRHEGPLVEARFAGTVSAARRDDMLRAAHAVTRLGLVVQLSGTTLSDWHRGSALDAATVLDVVERTVRSSSGPYCARRSFPPKWHNDDVSKVLLRTLRGRALRAEFTLATLGRLWRTARADARPVLGDLLMERLPTLLGHDFDVDLVLRQHLAAVQGLSPASVPMPRVFHDGLAERLRSLTGRGDTSDAETLQAAISSEDWKAARRLLRDDEPSHVQVLLALDDAQLRALAEHDCATQLANAAVRELARGGFREALRLYDAVLFAPELDARVCANPLFAVQDDNHHLGVDEVRARRYLERCLPYGPANPTIFLNAAFVFMELGEHDAALDALAKARAGGVDVKAQRNERLLAPLRTRPEFKALVR